MRTYGRRTRGNCASVPHRIFAPWVHDTMRIREPPGEEMNLSFPGTISKKFRHTRAISLPFGRFVFFPSFVVRIYIYIYILVLFLFLWFWSCSDDVCERVSVKVLRSADSINELHIVVLQRRDDLEINRDQILFFLYFTTTRLPTHLKYVVDLTVVAIPVAALVDPVFEACVAVDGLQEPSRITKMSL